MKKLSFTIIGVAILIAGCSEMKSGSGNYDEGHVFNQGLFSLKKFSSEDGYIKASIEIESKSFLSDFYIGLYEDVVSYQFQQSFLNAKLDSITFEYRYNNDNAISHSQTIFHVENQTFDEKGIYEVKKFAVDSIHGLYEKELEAIMVQLYSLIASRNSGKLELRTYHYDFHYILAKTLHDYRNNSPSSCSKSIINGISIFLDEKQIGSKVCSNFIQRVLDLSPDKTKQIQPSEWSVKCLD